MSLINNELKPTLLIRLFLISKYETIMEDNFGSN